MHDDPRDDRHDRGLAFDLASLRTRRPAPCVDRRHALRLLAGAGAGAVLVACGADGSSGSPSTTRADSTTASSTTSASGSSPVDPIPSETGGPFPGDGSNGPDVLSESGVVRQDIRSSFGDLSGTAEGVPLTIALQVVDAATRAPREGAAVYAWHCTRDGGYSLYSEGLTAQNFLRGVQAADADGNLTFQSIFPGAYPGRWPHVHFQVFDGLDAAATGNELVTSQLALPDDACVEAYATSGYEASASTHAGTTLSSDMVFSDGVDQQLAAVAGRASRGFTATLVVGV